MNDNISNPPMSIEPAMPIDVDQLIYFLVYHFGLLDIQNRILIIIGAFILVIMTIVGIITTLKAILSNMFDWSGYSKTNIKDDKKEIKSEGLQTEEQLKRERLFLYFVHEYELVLTKKLRRFNELFENTMIYAEDELNILHMTLLEQFRRILAIKLNASYEFLVSHDTVNHFEIYLNSSRNLIIQELREIFKKYMKPQNADEKNKMVTRHVDILIILFLQKLSTIKTIGSDLSYSEIKIMVENLKPQIVDHALRVVNQLESNRAIFDSEIKIFDEKMKKLCDDVLETLQ